MNNNDLSGNMHKSTTNRSVTNQPDSGIVSRSGLGKRVIVNGHYGGVLRYMGQVAGKEGVFCGIELDQPVGKNDGTHEGAFYFGCRPGHGVFAPCHKVQMEAMRRQTEGRGINEKGKASLIAKAERTLSRSAMPSLNTERYSSDIPSTSTHIPQMPMDWSLMSMSTVSNTSDSSYVIRTNNNNIDLMANSQATYTVFESDCPMLSDLELSESSLLRLDEEDDDDDRTAILGWILNENGYPRTFRPDESVILDGPSFGMDLPVITSPEPEEDMAETPMAETKNFSNGLIKLENKQNRSHLMLEGLEQQKRGNKEENKSPNMIADGKIDNACYLRTNVSNVSRNVQNPQREKETASKCREEKTRTSIFNSIPMSTQNHSAMNRLKPKTPSKSQLVMEKLKASIEAEKKSTKKEVKSKLLSSVGAPSKGEKRDDVVKSKSAETPTSTSGRKEVKNSVSEIKHPRSLPRTVTSSTPSKSLSSFGRIGSRKVLGSKENQSSKENPATIISKNVAKTPTKTSTNANLLNKDLAIEQQKLIEKLQKQLKNEKMNADVFIIVSKTLNEKNIRAQEEVNKLENLLKQINSNHELALQKLDDKWKNDFQKADELHKNEIEDVRSLLQADSQTKLEQLQIECERIVNEYEEKMNALKSQLVEQQKQFQLNESQRNKRLTDEIASRSFELQLKNEELARLRSENRDLQFRVETISEKDVQITKLEKKNEDLREGIDRLKQIEKSLISQLETIRHQRDQAINKTKEIEKDKEILEYRLTDEFKSPRSSNSTPLNFHNSNRTPLITTTERPNSSCLSLGRSQPSFENDMAKSIDSALSLVKCYQQEGRSKSQNTPTKIYTPRECYELTDPPVEKHSPILSMKQQRIIERTVDFEVNEDSLN